jgi:tetratricopeptide (TPR) repeat protein
MPRALATVLTAGLVLHAADAGRAQSLTPAPLDLLDQYARGDGERAAASLATVPHDRLEALGKAIQKAAPAWLQTADLSLARRRRLAAATLALDLAHTGLFTQWKVLRSLVEWGCTLVRQNPAGQSEHDWHLASVALAGGALDKDFLIESPYNPEPSRVFKHVNHAEAHFPADPRWRLARAMALAFGRMSEGVRDDGGSTSAVLASAAALPVSAMEVLQKRREASRQILTEFEKLLDVSGISPEAHLHLGHQRFVLRELDMALHHYQEAARLSDDPHVQYLAYFLAARLFEARKEPVDAARHYRRALEILPNVQSAATAVAAARFVDGAPDEAYGILESAFSTNPRPPDPWRLFFLGDYRFWPQVIQRLRAEIR